MKRITIMRIVHAHTVPWLFQHTLHGQCTIFMSEWDIFICQVPCLDISFKIKSITHQYWLLLQIIIMAKGFKKGWEKLEKNKLRRMSNFNAMKNFH